MTGVRGRAPIGVYGRSPGRGSEGFPEGKSFSAFAQHEESVN